MCLVYLQCCPLGLICWSGFVYWIFWKIIPQNRSDIFCKKVWCWWIKQHIIIDKSNTIAIKISDLITSVICFSPFSPDYLINISERLIEIKVIITAQGSQEKDGEGRTRSSLGNIAERKASLVHLGFLFTALSETHSQPKYCPSRFLPHYCFTNSFSTQVWAILARF